MSGCVGKHVAPHFSSKLGAMLQPNIGNKMEDFAFPWAADNGCFSGGWSESRWMRWLEKVASWEHKPLFAVVPDVVGDKVETERRWNRYSRYVRDLGFPVAFVSQDGCSVNEMPWEEMDTLFIGGSTEWKLGNHTRLACVEARRRGVRVHMGRVNSFYRMCRAADFGARSVDGTFLKYGPCANMPILLKWLEDIVWTEALFQ